MGQIAVHHNAGRCAHVTIAVAPIPDVTSIVGLITGTVVALLVAELVDLAGTEARTNGDAAKGGL